MAHPTPVSADEIARRTYEHQHLVEDRVLSSLIEVVNQGIRDQVAHGMFSYTFQVPCFILGFPRFNVDYVADRLRGMYRDKRFKVSGEGSFIVIEWPNPTSRHHSQKKKSGPPASSRSKKVLLLPG